MRACESFSSAWWPRRCGRSAADCAAAGRARGVGHRHIRNRIEDIQMAMMRLTILAVVILAACATTATNEPNADVLMKLDREFAKASAARGGMGWQEYMAPNAVKPSNGGRILNGPQEIGDNMNVAFASGFTLTWEPTRAEISRGGKIG